MNISTPVKYIFAKWKIFSITGLFFIFLFMAIRYYHIHNHTYNSLNNAYAYSHQWNQAQQWEDQSLWLPDFTFDIHSHAIEGIEQNLSGLSYDYDNHQLIGIINSPPEIITLNTQGNLLHRYPLSGANDTEGIAYLGGNIVAILQEKRRSVLLIELPSSGTEISVQEENAYQLNIPEDRNNGPEGITYDPTTDTLYIVKERLPVGLYAIQGLLTDPQNATQTNLSPWLENIPFATDLSSIEFDPIHGNLILLSDEAQMLITISTRGEPVNFLDLAPLNLQIPPPQPEGLAVDHLGTVYIVSEPNIFYRLVQQDNVVLTQ